MLSEFVVCFWRRVPFRTWNVHHVSVVFLSDIETHVRDNSSFIALEKYAFCIKQIHSAMKFIMIAKGLSGHTIEELGLLIVHLGSVDDLNFIFVGMYK